MIQPRRKILVISGVFPPSQMAEGDHVLHICRMLTERGFEVEVLTKKGSVATGLPFAVHAIMDKWSWFELPRLVSVARRLSPDAVFLYFVGHAYDLHPMITFVPTILKRLLPAVTVTTQITVPVGSVTRFHSVATRLLRRAVAALAGGRDVDYSFGTLLRDSDRVIVMATPHLRTLELTYPALAAKTTLIPPPALTIMSPDTRETRARGRRALGVPDADFLFAYFGRLYRGKGLETLLEAFQIVRTRHPGARLAIIGGEAGDCLARFKEDWHSDSLRELVRQLDIEDSVVWTGEFPWDSDAGSAYLRAVDVAVLPFDAGVQLNNSSFATVAGHGLPTVTTRGAELEGPFLDGENVVLCLPRDPTALASAMARLLEDQALRTRLRAGIEALSKEWFSWDKSIDRTIAAFHIAPSPANRPTLAADPVGIEILGPR